MLDPVYVKSRVHCHAFIKSLERACVIRHLSLVLNANILLMYVNICKYGFRERIRDQQERLLRPLGQPLPVAGGILRK